MNPRAVACIACLFSLSVPGFAQQPTPPPAPIKHSLSMNVKNVGSGGPGSTTNSTRGISGSGISGSTTESSRTQKVASAPSYSVELYNSSRTPDKVTVEWYVFAKSVSGGHAQPYLHDSGKIPLAIDAGKSTSAIFQPRAIERESTTTATHNTQTTSVAGNSQTSTSTSFHRSASGNKIFGWVVRLVGEDNLLIAAKASEPSLEPFGKNPPAPKPTPRPGPFIRFPQ